MRCGFSAAQGEAVVLFLWLRKKWGDCTGYGVLGGTESARAWCKGRVTIADVEQESSCPVQGRHGLSSKKT